MGRDLLGNRAVDDRDLHGRALRAGRPVGVRHVVPDGLLEVLQRDVERRAVGTRAVGSDFQMGLEGQAA